MITDNDVEWASPIDPSIKLYMPQKEADWFKTLEGGFPEAPLIAWAKETFADPNGAFIDIGANCGTWAFHLAKSFSHVFAFEPHPDSFHCLRRAQEAYGASGFRNLELFNVALGDKKAIVPLREWHNDIREDLEDRDLSDCVHVPLMALDDALWSAKRDRWHWAARRTKVALIKIDVEGFEERVLYGARSMLINAERPPILFEAWDEHAPASLELLEDYGYNVSKISWPQMYLATKKA